MINEYDSLIKAKRNKYKPSRTGEISLGIAISSLSIGLLATTLNIMNIFKLGYISLGVSIAFIVVAMFATLVLYVDVIRFNKLNNLNENSNSNIIVYVLIGVIIGFMWGKLL